VSASSNNQKNNRNTIVPNGQYLRQLRAKLGLTQIELAFRLDLSERLVRKAEKSRRIDARNLVLFRLFFEQQGLAIDPEKIGQMLCDSPKSMAVSFFDACLVQGDLQSIVQQCHEQVSAEINGRVAIGHANVKALFLSFANSTPKEMEWTTGAVLNESIATSIFWSRTPVGQSGARKCHCQSTERGGAHSRKQASRII
jgi:DNA-binding XRE family transcriptional regulator